MGVAELVSEVDALRAKLDAHRPYTPDVAKRVSEWLAPRFLYSSGALGAKAALSAAQIAVFLEREICSGGHPLQRYLRLAAHKRGLERIQTHAHDAGGVIDVNLVREIHRVLWVGCRADAARPGLWKQKPSRPMRRWGRLLHYAEPDDIPTLMEKLCEEFARRRAEQHPLRAIAWFYYHLNLIHPFSRDNGRLSRLLATCALEHHGYPPLIVAPEDLGAYLDAMAACDSTVPPDSHAPLAEKIDVSSLQEFFCASLLRTGGNLLDVLDRSRADADTFASEVARDQESLVKRLNAKEDMSWRINAAAQVRSLHERLALVARKLVATGAVYRITLDESECVHTHAISRRLAAVLPTGDAGVVGSISMEIAGKPALGVRMPDPVRLQVAVAASRYALQVVLYWGDKASPEVQHGPKKADEWPSSSVDRLLTRAIDDRRRRFEKDMLSQNASNTERLKALRERLEIQRQPNTTAIRAANQTLPREPAAEAAPTRRGARDAQALDGIKPSEPPLAF
ncbi:Fic family protein [Planctomycetota bacterium]|nr:Fic family protein [Planctomycetota bacterium]